MVWITGISICLLLLAADLHRVQVPDTQVGWAVGRMLVAAMFAPGFAMIQTCVVRRRWLQVSHAARPADNVLRNLESANFLVWLSASAAIICILGWPAVVRVHWQLGQWVLLDELLVAAPLILSAVVSWLVIFDSHQLAQPPVAKSGRRKNLLTHPGLNWVWQRFRILSGLVLIPVLVLFLMRDAANLWFPGEPSGVVLGFGFCILLVLLWVSYPMIAAATWKTSPLDDPDLQKDLDEICRSRGIRPETVRVWHTGGLLVNAVVVGLVPGFRRVFLTDELLRQFDRHEIRAIYRHEMGHIVFHHLWIRNILLLGPLLAVCLLACLMSGVDGWPLAVAGLPDWTLWIPTVAGIVAWLALLVVPVVRRSELQADRYAVLDTQGLISPVLCDEYCDALVKLGQHNPGSWLRGTVWHPSIRTRWHRIRQFSRQPDCHEAPGAAFQLQSGR